MSNRIVVIGEALIDLIQQDDGRYEAKPGGAPANVSIALARLGANVSFAGRMSTDKFGEKLHNWLSPESIDLSLVERTSDPTSLAVASLDAAGKASYSFYLKGTADWGWTLGAFMNLEVDPPAALVIGSVATAIEPGASVIENLAGHLHSTENSTVAIDLNIRPGLGFERHAETVRVERQIKLAHIVKASDDDLAWLYPERLPVDTARLWAGAGHHVIMTRGADGATLFTPTGDTVSVPATLSWAPRCTDCNSAMPWALTPKSAWLLSLLMTGSTCWSSLPVWERLPAHAPAATHPHSPNSGSRTTSPPAYPRW
jgi:fructokinase